MWRPFEPSRDELERIAREQDAERQLEFMTTQTTSVWPRCNHPLADYTCDGKNHNHATDLDHKPGQPWD